MTKYRKSLAVVAAAALSVTGLAACGGGGGQAEGAKTLYYLTFRPAEHLDPQRMYIGRDLANTSRLVYRTLVTFPVSEDMTESTTPVPDLATDTGTASNNGATWKFTLKDGVKWEDGKPVTCEDLKYGASRVFATDVIIGGPNYALGYIDAPDYKGPYNENAKGKAQFDKAITCDGNTITYNFNKPWQDFPLALAALHMFDPYRKDKDQGDKSNYAIFSNGPYKLDGKWVKDKGGTFVKNDEWDAATDEVRKQHVDKIVFQEGLTNEIIAQRLVADRGNDQYAVTDRNIPPSAYASIKGAAADRATLVDSPFTGYLVPNFKRLKDPNVRRALMLGTNQEGWIAALGGEKSAKPSQSIVNPAVSGYAPNPAFEGLGDFAAAKKTLKKAGKLGYPIIFTFSGGSPTSQKAAAALKEGWEKSGFKVSLNELTDTYYTEVQKPNLKSDVAWGGWGADWPSISTVIPPLFDSRINLSPKSNGQNYGNYDSAKANKMFDEASAAPLAEQPAMWVKVDEFIGRDVAYIPLDVTQFYMLHGSKVSGYMQTAASNMYPELGSIGVE